MNKEVIKAMNKKETKIDKIRKWWNKNGYKVMRVILFPLWLGIKAKEKIEAHLNFNCEWSDKRANEILNYYIPRKADWNEKDKCFYFFDNGMGWESKYNKRFIKFRDRRWWGYNCSCWGGKIRTYLIENFELEGFEKIVDIDYDQCTSITFKMIEK